MVRISRRRVAPLILAVLVATGGVTACGSLGSGSASSSASTLKVGAIPDQDPELLQRRYGTVADRLADELGVDVAYVPVTDYAAAVTLFGTGDLDMVWFGGLTGVQARVQTPGARAIAQRAVDAEFHSVFIASRDAKIGPISDVAGLSTLAGRRMTFGSESSTSGRLMPQYYLLQAGVGPDDFAGPPGFSGSHDATIDLVSAGSYEVGALNEQVWASRLEAGDVDTSTVQEIFRTPAYHDYHWLLRPDVDQRFGDGFSDRVQQVLLGLDGSDPDDAALLDLFGAKQFVETRNDNYAEIEQVGHQLGLLRP